MAAYKPIRIGDSVPLQQINPSTETIDGKIQVTQTGVVLGRSSAGAGGHEEILFADLPGGGGASYTEITYADMATALAGSTLTPGGWYLITDAAGTDLGFLTYAVKTNEISPAGVGGYLNADFQAVGDYSGVAAITGQAAGTQQGIWRTLFEAVTINYVGLEGGAFAVGDTITGGTTLATAVILTDDGVSSMTAYMTSAGVAFDGSELLDNGNGVAASMDGAASAPTIAQGDVVIWNLLHWQLTDITKLYGASPDSNVLAYTQLLKTDSGQGYITAWDVSEFDFPNNLIKYRKDQRDNVVYSNISVIGFPFGSNTVRENFVLGGQISGNCIGQIRRNILYQDASISTSGLGDVTECILYTNSQISVNVSEDSSITGCTLYPSATITGISIGQESLVEYNILENGASLTGITAGANCSISGNKIGQGAYIGEAMVLPDDSTILYNTLGPFCNIRRHVYSGAVSLERNNLVSSSNINDINGGSGCSIIQNVVYQGSRCANITLGDDCEMSSNVLLPESEIGDINSGNALDLVGNIIENTGVLIEITAGANCSISRNKIGQGATLGGSTTMGDGALINDNISGPGSTMVNYSMDAGASIRKCTIFGAFSDIQMGIDAVMSEIEVQYSAALGFLVLGNASELGQMVIKPGGGFTNKTLPDGAYVYTYETDIYAGEVETVNTFEKVRSVSGFSNVPDTIDITALTAIDCLAENNYVGIFNLTSTNATEAIDTITNPPTLFPFTLRPAAGLTLTITGTAYAGIAAGQIALKAASYALDGSKGEYIVLEIDPLGTGALIEKQVVNGLI